jgi:thymidylate kinase
MLALRRRRTMPIICLEGPSAVGKTTTAGLLASREGTRVVPEVNVLYRSPRGAPADWYLERQVDRWRMARDRTEAGLSVLDGDPFQPLWYNWAYDFRDGQSLDALEAYYRPLLVHGTLNFPDRYIILGASVEVLRGRRNADGTRQRRGFERHLRFIEPQIRYFEAVQSFSPEQVRFVEASTTEATVAAVSRVIPRGSTHQQSVALFEFLIEWLREHPLG